MTDWIVAICSIISIFIGMATLYQLFIQLKNLNTTLRNSTLATLIDLENEIIRRKENLDSVGFEIRQYEINLKEETPNSEIVHLFVDKDKSALENYLNSLDRLSYCILNNYFLERDWRSEYRDVIFDIVDKKQEEFGVSSRYRNIKKLYNRWKDK